jgi:hypothetical protein
MLLGEVHVHLHEFHADYLHASVFQSGDDAPSESSL